MTDYRVNVIVDPDGAKKGSKEAERALEGIQKRAGALRQSISTALTGLVTFATIRETLQLADTYQNLQNRLRAVSDESVNLAQVQSELEGISRRTRSSLASTTELYARLIVNSKELGKSQAQVLQFTESLNKAVTLSGATAEEASAGIIQLSQGLASGALRGDELRSVLEQLPAVADVIARGLGVTRGQLRQLGQEGKLSAEAIFDAFEKLGPELDEKFGRTVPTLSQSLTVFKNEVLSFVGATDQASGTTRGLGTAFQFLGEAIKEARDFYTGYQEVLAQPQAEAALASVGFAINSINKEIKALEARGTNVEGVVNRIAELRKQLEGFQNRARTGTTLVDPNAAKEAAEAQKQAAAAAAAQKAALDSIRGPQEEYRVKIEAITALLSQGKISQEEYNAAIEKLGKGLEKVAGVDPSRAFEEQRQALQDQNDLLSAKLALGSVVADRLAIEQELAKQGVTLTAEQQQQLEKLLTVQENLKSVEERRTEEAEKRKALQEQEAQAIQSLTESLDVAAQVALEEQRLNEVLALRPDLVNQVNERLEDLRLRSLEASTALEDGFSRAFIKIKREAEDLASVGEDIVNVFANQATDAITEFATTGQFSFKEFASAILKDLTRIIARLLVVQALNAAIGALGGNAGGAANAAAGAASSGLEARADGGPVSANRSYLVGEEGPEVFTPGRSGTITPNGAVASAPPQVNVQVVNVTDPNEVPQAIAGGRADEAILNALARNPDRVKQVIQ